MDEYDYNSLLANNIILNEALDYITKERDSLRKQVNVAMAAFNKLDDGTGFYQPDAVDIAIEAKDEIKRIWRDE